MLRGCVLYETFLQWPLDIRARVNNVFWTHPFSVFPCFSLDDRNQSKQKLPLYVERQKQTSLCSSQFFIEKENKKTDERREMNRICWLKCTWNGIWLRLRFTCWQTLLSSKTQNEFSPRTRISTAVSVPLHCVIHSLLADLHSSSHRRNSLFDFTLKDNDLLAASFDTDNITLMWVRKRYWKTCPSLLAPLFNFRYVLHLFSKGQNVMYYSKKNP